MFPFWQVKILKYNLDPEGDRWWRLVQESEPTWGWKGLCQSSLQYTFTHPCTWQDVTAQNTGSQDLPVHLQRPTHHPSSSTSSHLHCRGEGHRSVQLNLKTHPNETRTCAGAHSQQPGTALPDWPGPLLFLHVWLGAGGKPLPKTIIGLTKGTMGRQFMTNKERSSLPSKKKNNGSKRTKLKQSMAQWKRSNLH